MPTTAEVRRKLEEFAASRPESADDTNREIFRQLIDLICGAHERGGPEEVRRVRAMVNELVAVGSPRGTKKKSAPTAARGR